MAWRNMLENTAVAVKARHFALLFLASRYESPNLDITCAAVHTSRLPHVNEKLSFQAEHARLILQPTSMQQTSTRLGKTFVDCHLTHVAKAGTAAERGVS